ncbi:MAG: type II toxin-antitoxin system PemK/MazF family toxin [Dehalococcoidia bacterium]
MKQGEIRWCQFPGPDRMRPAVVLTRDSVIPALGAITVAPLTTKLRDLDSRVRLGESDGLRGLSDVNLHNLQTLSKPRIGALMATLSGARMREVSAAIAFALGFDRYEED